MSKCKINIPITEPIESLIGKTKQRLASSSGSSLVGDLEKGNLTIATAIGKIIGNYKVANGAIQFEITDKPMFIGCDRIESELKKYLSAPAV